MTKEFSEFNKTDFFAEQHILRALTVQPEFMSNQRINEDLFNFKVTKDVFKSIQELIDSNSELNVENLIVKFIVRDETYKRSTIDDIFAIEYTNKTDINALIDQLEDCKKRRLFIQHIELSLEKIREKDCLDQDVTKEIQELIEEASLALSNNIKTVNSILTLPQWTTDYLEQTKNRRLGKQFSFRSFLDYLITDGPVPGDFGIITARSGSGKSALVLNQVNILINNNIPCMFFSLEMGALNTMDRLMAIRTDIPYSDIKYPKDPSVFDRTRVLTEQEASIMDCTNFRFSESPSLSLADIKKHVQKFQKDIGQTYCIVFIDLLSMVSDFTKNVNGQNSAFTMEQGVNKLSAMCKELGIHVVGVVQLNRGADEKVRDLSDIKRLRPTVAQIKNAKAFEERARWVIGTHRTKHYVDQFLKYDTMSDIDKAELNNFIDEKTGSDKMEVMVLKQNSGDLKTCEAWFNGPTFKIDYIERETKSDIETQENE